MEDREETLAVLPECFVYKIPPRTSAAGYRAENWNLSNFLWSGRVIVTGKGETCTVRLEDVSTGNVFAVCPVNMDGPRAVEPVLDSSRYFVLRIEDGKGHHAFIGMGFTERGDAFDFNVALQEHAKRVRQSKELKEAQKRLASEPAMDFSLKQGETISINIKGKAKKKGGDAPSSGGLGPPPGSAAAPPASGDDEWTDFAGSKPSSSSGGDWVSF